MLRWLGPVPEQSGHAAAHCAEPVSLLPTACPIARYGCLTRGAPAGMLAAVQTIDLYSLLLATHGFFESLGVDEIRRRSQADDKPLRMVKTILHELCKLKGTEIYRYAC